MEKITLTIKEINDLSATGCERLVVCYGDGQGDVYCNSLGDLKRESEEDEEDEKNHSSNSDVINEIYSEHGGNMVELIYLNNGMLHKLNITH